MTAAHTSSPAPAKRKRAARPARIFDQDGNEVFVTLTCPHCGKTKPLRAFGLRKMADGKIRNCPWCSACRANPGVPVHLDAEMYAIRALAVSIGAAVYARAVGRQASAGARYAIMVAECGPMASTNAPTEAALDAKARCIRDHLGIKGW